MFEKGPNMFVLYNEKSYDQRNTLHDTVDISSWVKKAKFPL